MTTAYEPPRSTRALVHYRTVPPRIRALREIGSLPQPLVDPGPVRAHVVQLHVWGLTDDSIARAAGLSTLSVTNVRLGRWARTKRDVAAALLAVSHVPHPRQKLVLSVGALRRVRALMAAGWSYDAMGEHLGLPGKTVQSWTRQQRMTYAHWVVVRDLFDRLQLVPGTSAANRTRAARCGWAPPLAWDEDLIDHPDATPWSVAADTATPHLDDALLLRVLALRAVTLTPRDRAPIYVVPEDARPIRVPLQDRPLYVAELLARGWPRYEVQRALGTSTASMRADLARVAS